MSTSFRPNGLTVPRSRLPSTPVRVVEPPPPATPEETGNITVPEDPQELEPAICPICKKTVTDASESDAGDNAIFCEGECKRWLHRCCACLPKPESDKINEEDPFYCPRCSMLVQMKAIRELRDTVAILSTQVQDLQAMVSVNANGYNGESASLTNSGNNTTEGWATVVRRHQRRQSNGGRLSNTNSAGPNRGGSGGRHGRRRGRVGPSRPTAVAVALGSKSINLINSSRLMQQGSPLLVPIPLARKTGNAFWTREGYGGIPLPSVKFSMGLSGW